MRRGVYAKKSICREKGGKEHDKCETCWEIDKGFSQFGWWEMAGSSKILFFEVLITTLKKYHDADSNIPTHQEERQFQSNLLLFSVIKSTFRNQKKATNIQPLGIPDCHPEQTIVLSVEMSWQFGWKILKGTKKANIQLCVQRDIFVEIGQSNVFFINASIREAMRVARCQHLSHHLNSLPFQSYLLC